MNNRRWTKEEDKYLKDKWGVVKAKSIADKLGRTERAVLERGYNTLKLGPQVNWYTLKEIQEITGIHKDTLRVRIIKTKIKYTKGKTKQKPWLVDDINLKKFLKENCDLWHANNLTINIFDFNDEWYLEKVEADKSRTDRFRKPWTEYEDNVLLDRLSRGYTYEDIAKELNRTTQGVYGRHKYKYRLKY